MGARLQLPSLVDEFVCDTAEGTDFLKASNQLVGKVANKFRADINIPFPQECVPDHAESP